jgi:hypothetical protein
MDRRLDPSKREIRLLTLLPRENDASIDCSLCITSLEDYSTHKEYPFLAWKSDESSDRATELMGKLGGRKEGLDLCQQPGGRWVGPSTKHTMTSKGRTSKQTMF